METAAELTAAGDTGRGKSESPQKSQGLMTLFVTGGAGFIGSEFIRQAITESTGSLISTS